MRSMRLRVKKPAIGVSALTPMPPCDLDRAVGDSLGHLRRDHLNGGDQIARDLVAIFVHGVGGFQREQARLLDLAPGAGDVLTDAALVREFLAEGNAAFDPLRHDLQCALRLADRAHAVMDAARTKTSLRDFKAAARAENHVGLRDAHVLQTQLRLAAGRIHARRIRFGCARCECRAFHAE